MMVNNLIKIGDYVKIKSGKYWGHIGVVVDMYPKAWGNKERVALVRLRAHLNFDAEEFPLDKLEKVLV